MQDPFTTCRNLEDEIESGTSVLRSFIQLNTCPKSSILALNYKHFLAVTLAAWLLINENPQCSEAQADAYPPNGLLTRGIE